MLDPRRPALILAPMEGVTDAPMRAFMGELGGFTYAVSEFQRVNESRIPRKVFLREIPELNHGARTPSGLPVQVQILGGNPDRMAESALNAISVGATAIDINFGCPAPTVNRHDGGASILREPCRLREIVRTVRDAVPQEIPVSAKIRLGWEKVDDVDLNANMAAEGGASWVTVHARTRTQGYKPPVFWDRIGRVRAALDIPVVANGDIWSLDDFMRCRDETGCQHFMIGRGAMANPALPGLIAKKLQLTAACCPRLEWPNLLRRLAELMTEDGPIPDRVVVMKFKQWLKLATIFGGFDRFNQIKELSTTEEILQKLCAYSLHVNCK